MDADCVLPIVEQRITGIKDEQIKRIANLVPREHRTLMVKCCFEVCSFYSHRQVEINKMNIDAKFRSYWDAEEYAQKLVTDLCYREKVIVRLAPKSKPVSVLKAHFPV